MKGGLQNMSRQKTLADREQYVVKANDLIRKTRYSLTAQQQKIILFAISKIKPDDDITTKYTFDFLRIAKSLENTHFYKESIYRTFST